jgi:hypothetical protein
VSLLTAIVQGPASEFLIAAAIGFGLTGVAEVLGHKRG